MKIHSEFDFIRISLYNVEKLSKLKKISMENEKDSNMATPIFLPTLISKNGKQRPLVSFAVPISFPENLFYISFSFTSCVADVPPFSLTSLITLIF